jgi:hypothetical protein
MIGSERSIPETAFLSNRGNFLSLENSDELSNVFMGETGIENDNQAPSEDDWLNHQV